VVYHIFLFQEHVNEDGQYICHSIVCTAMPA